MKLSLGEGLWMLVFVLTCVLGLLAFPTSPIGRLLRQYLVEAPARWLNAIRPGHIAMLGGMTFFGLVMFWLFDAEGLRVFGMMAPEIGVWFSAFELSLVMDALAVGLAMATATRLRDTGLLVWRAIRRGASAVVRRIAPRALRSGPRPPRTGEKTSDPEPWAWAPAWA